MGSIFDDNFGESGVTSLMDYNGDGDQLVNYHPPGGGATVSGITAMIGHEQVIELEGEDGTIRKEYRRTITVTNDAASTWKGIDDPQLRGTVEMLGFIWGIEDREQLAVEGRSENLLSLSLVRKRPTSKSYAGFRK